jgi:hypothetical protein
MKIHTPISYGELIDKITILELKKNNIKDLLKLNDINKELDDLLYIYNNKISSINTLVPHKEKLYKINKKLWGIEDDIRDKERKKEFDNEFIQLARSVYITNDERMSVKHIINELMGSNIKEHKSYKPYI